MNISYKIRELISRKLEIGIAMAAIVLLASLVVGPALAQELPRSQTTWTTTGEGGVDVIPYIQGNRQLAFVDFQSKNFDDIQYVYFNFTYNTTAQGTKRGVEGSFVPALETFKYFDGVPYVRRQLLFGTCSKNVCTYDPNPRDVKITVNTKMKSGPVDQYTRVINVPN